MTSVFNKSGIILGTLHKACLVCGVDICSERDAALHMEKDEHLKNLEKCAYVDEFFNDKIRKVKIGYFCEICNKRVPNLEKGRSHVLENEHIRRNDNALYECLGTDLLLFKEVAITKEAWNGIVDGKCVLCDIGVEDIENHISKPEHKAKIIKDDVEFRIYNGLYRMLGNSFQCMTCNEVFRLVKTSIWACVTTHFLRDKHKQISDEMNFIAIEAKDKSMLKEINPYKECKKYDPDTLIIKKEPMSQFVKNFYAIEVPFLGGTDIVINAKLVINIFSYYFITKDTLRCAACDLKLTIEQIDAHNGTSQHETAMKDTPVVVLKSAEDEFIREVRPGMFHCGFCNCTERGLDNVMEHFASFAHRESRTSASWRLHMYIVTKKT